MISLLRNNRILKYQYRPFLTYIIDSSYKDLQIECTTNKALLWDRYAIEYLGLWPLLKYNILTLYPVIVLLEYFSLHMTFIVTT